MIISKTPFRMSFVGGGSDLKDYYQHSPGAVVSTTINKHVYVTVNKRFVDNIKIGYSQTEDVKDVKDIKHNLVRESLKAVGIKKGIDISYLSDMLSTNEGSGLGGSSSFLVGTLNALHAYKGRHTASKALAEKACEIEIEKLGNPIGKQDQYAAAFGGFNHIIFKEDGSVIVNPIIFKNSTKQKLTNNLLLFYTGINTTSSSVLGEQKEKTTGNKKIIDKMVELTYDVKKALENNDLTQFGNLLGTNWEYKKKLASKISNSAIDCYYEKAKGAGALGGKILGSGGGGFLLVYCEKENQQEVRNALSDLREAKFKFEQEGSKIIYVYDPE
ncbi:MAG: GHMP kinase [Nanoarchaeota archaeon]|nr:GHMP kinase [Nanoarchaeota archaeon]|tara:strand:- start:16 stop:1002 length:987 start_codon:yes stop_codon:yes gene_type:complete